ncbi:MAG: DNA polymerase III subunit delta [Bacteroidales bacterium]|nr:DNA polymerase III subunit delta [Bacteroidales bacterium]
MQFRDIVGQQKIKERLLETVKSGRISHAQLFLGKGVNGKFALALAYGQYINCTNRSTSDSCGVCPSCIKYQALTHPDLFFTFPVNKGKDSTSAKDLISPMFNKQWVEFLKENKYYPHLQDWYKKIEIENKQGNINVAEARRIVRDLHFKPSEAQQKVLIIWQPEKMNISSANLLLKFFEEPPENTLIIMVSDEKDQLLRTIQSRFQLIPIPKIADQDMKNHLQGKFPKLNNEQLITIINLANGDLQKAYHLISSSDQVKEHFIMFQSWMQICFKRGSLEEIKSFVEKTSRIGRENQKQFLDYGLRLMRECLLSNYGHPSIQRLTKYESDWLKRFSPFVHINNGPILIEKFDSAINEIGRNANASVLFMNLSLDLSQLLKMKE